MVDENIENNSPKTPSIEGVDDTPSIPSIPDILTRVSSEKFRRRLLIASRLIAILLILGICYYGFGIYEYNTLLKEIDAHPCFLCGYHHGMNCQYVYFNWNELADIDKENFFLNLGYSNINQSTIIFYGGLPNEYINISELNLSD